MQRLFRKYRQKLGKEKGIKRVRKKETGKIEQKQSKAGSTENESERKRTRKRTTNKVRQTSPERKRRRTSKRKDLMETKKSLWN